MKPEKSLRKNQGLVTWVLGSGLARLGGVSWAQRPWAP